MDICEKTIIPSYLGSADPPPKTTQIPRLGGNTRLSVFGVTSIDSASPILLSFDAGPTTTVGVLGFGVLAAAIGAFVFANVAYTPEIMEGAQEMRQSNREVEIRKLVNAVRSHTDEGNEPAELRLPLETALGKTLEDYAAAVDLSSGDNDDTGGGDYLIVTAADKDLAKAIKQII